MNRFDSILSTNRSDTIRGEFYKNPKHSVYDSAYRYNMENNDTKKPYSPELASSYLKQFKAITPDEWEMLIMI